MHRDAPSAQPITTRKVEIISNNKIIDHGVGNSNDLKKENKADGDCNVGKTISMFDFLADDSVSTIPIFMKYFAFHESLVLVCGGVYYLNADIGVLCLSIIPGLSIIGVFLHFLFTQFNRNNLQIKSTFFSSKHYSVALSIFVIGLVSITAIYHTNTYLSYLVPNTSSTVSSSSTHSFIDGILRFPYKYSTRTNTQNQEAQNQNPFNYRISFVGSIIAPIIEESSKFLLIAITFPVSFLWTFYKTQHQKTKSNNYTLYCIQSLFLMFIGLCGGCGIAIMENIGYLAACQWHKTMEYCLPNKNFDILGAGLARGIFSVPFHCVTACIMADMLCIWMNTKCAIFHRNRVLYYLKFLLSYPVAIIIPVFLHSSFNFWMKGLPFITGLVTIAGFAFVSSRMAKKYAVIHQEEEMKKMEDIQTDSLEFDLAITKPMELVVL